MRRLAIAILLSLAASAQAETYIVQFHGQADVSGLTKNDVVATLAKSAVTSQANAVALLRRRSVMFRSFFIANAIAIENPDPSLIEALSRLPEVKRIRIDSGIRLRLPKQSEGSYPLANEIPQQIFALGIDRVWNELNVTGRGIVVGSIDTGAVWDHEALRSRYRGLQSDGTVDHSYSWHDATRKLAVPYDDHSHGTHTIGTMVGEQKGRDRFGVAPDAKWIACRAFERARGTVANFLECMEFLIAPKGRTDLAPHVVNLSWNCGEPEGCKIGDELLDGVRALKAAGILVVVAAGNDGPSCSTTFFAPTFYSQDVLTVAAYDHRNGEICDFSSRGPSTWDKGLTPSITAPGDFLRSSVPGGYGFKTGTSMAAPHVAGVAALILSAKPELVGQVDRIVDLIHKTAVPRQARQTCGTFPGSSVPNAVFGYGVINAFNAVTYGGYSQ